MLLEKPLEIELRLSYSRISDFAQNGPKTLLQRTVLKSSGVSFGSICDIMLVDRVTKSKHFKERYYCHEGNKPTATLGLLCDIILNNYNELPDKTKILEIIKLNEFWPGSTKEESILAKFDIPEFWNYIKIKHENRDKEVIMHKDLLDAEECVSALLNHKHTKHLFENSFENYYQYEFNSEYKGFKIRGFIDKMSIDHKNKIVYMDDIKTGSSKASEFMSSFIKFGYYFQEAVYTNAFTQIAKDLGLENYKLAPFRFIFIGRFEKVPFVFEVTKKWHDAAINGFKTSSGYKYKGLSETVDEIYYHWFNKLYEFPMEVYKENGLIKLDDSFIKEI